MTAFPDAPNPMFNSYLSSESLPSTSSYDPTHHTSSSRCNLSQPEPVEKTSVAVQTEVGTWDTQTDCQLTASLWRTEFAVAELEQQNKKNLIELKTLKTSLRCANRSRPNAEAIADRAESKLEISGKVTSDLFEENTSKAESLQPELLEANKTNILLNQKMDDYDLANKRVEESLNKKTSQIMDRAAVEKFVKQLQVMKVEIDIQRAEDIQLIQAGDGKQYEKPEKCLHALLTHANHWDWKEYEKHSNFNVERGNIKKCINHLLPNSI